MRGNLRFRPGLTISELLLLIVCTGIAMTVGLVVLAPARELCNGRRSCLNNMKMLGTAMLMYVQDYDDYFPSYPADVRHDWGNGPWDTTGRSGGHFSSSSFWVAQMLPYVTSQLYFRCPDDANPERNNSSQIMPGSETPFPVSYGPNLLFVDPRAYGGPSGPWSAAGKRASSPPRSGAKRAVALANVGDSDEKYLLADCMTAHGFDLETVAYIRYPNYDPSLQQNGWWPDQFTALGRVSWPEREVEAVSRHHFGTNTAFADGHAKWVRSDQIPDNDGPHGKRYQQLEARMVP